MKKFIILLLSILHCSFSMAQIGTWKAYMAYSDIQEIQKAGDELFVMASNDLYQYNLNDQSIYTYDKTNGLNDTNIKHIKWCSQAQRLIVVYENSNIDLIETDGDIINISDLYTKVITGDKTVSSIRIDGVYAYLICGFGIVKVNMERAEISDSYTPNHPEYPTDLPAEDNSDYDKYIETVKTLNPGGPKYNYFGYMKYYDGKLYTCSSYNYQGCIQVKENDKWIIYQDTDLKEITGLNTYKNVRELAINPNDHNHVFAGARNGLYEFKDGKLIGHYQQTNSPIEPFNGQAEEYQLVYGVFCDGNNVWCLNSQAPTKSLLKMNMTTHQWESYDIPSLMVFNDENFKNKSLPYMEKMTMDSRGLIWFVNNFWDHPSLHYFYIDNNEEIETNSYYSFTNQDNVDISITGGVKCIAEDLEHNIWIGTNIGPLLLEKDNILNDTPVFTQVKVPRNDGTDYADYLLSGIDVTGIAIDAGGRKWFSTNGVGVFLISNDNFQQLQHFTTDNSPLISDIVLSVAIDDTTGEVFFGTDKGLCSYISDATRVNDEMTKDNVYAYPNPVTPDYTGLITINGLTYNADVKIMNSSGKLVAEGRSNGGTFTWDGRDKKGNRVASGVYMVATATSEGKKGTVCKIAIIR